ncbi:hypothetical protein ACP275_08G131300 [Erythranthe tilingii]
MNIEVAATESFRYLIKFPPISRDSLHESLLRAIEELQIDEKTKTRDAIQLQIEEKLADNEILGVYYDFLKLKDINASGLLKAKLIEIDHLQSIVTKVGNALSIVHINNQICDLENKIKHDVLALESQRREKLSSSSSFFDIIVRQYREVREEAEEFLKVVLRKELAILTDSSIKAKAAVTEFKKKCDDAAEQVEKLQANYRAASDVCIEAIAIKENMKKKYCEKIAMFAECLSDTDFAPITNEIPSDPMQLSRYCKHNVENFMQRWNKWYRLRVEYAKYNESSTMNRFGSLDGCSLHPDYEKNDAANEN